MAAKKRLLFAAFALVVLVKCLLIQRFCIGIILIQPWNCGIAAWLAFWLPKLSVALAVALPLLPAKRTGWSIIWMIVLDLWMIANLIYFRANASFLSLDAIRMTGNLDGFTSSVWLFINWKTYLFALLTIAYAAVWWFCRCQQRLWKDFAYTASAVVVLSLIGSICNYSDFRRSQKKDRPLTADWFNPFDLPKPLQSENWLMERQQFNYIMRHSIVTYSVNMVVEGVRLDNKRKADVSFSDNELQWLLPIREKMQTADTLQPKYNLILVLVESLESWPLLISDNDGNEVMPCLKSFMQKHPHFYAHHITSQVKQGMSGDGHMITNTGLLPISSGAACLLYSHNTYPRYADRFASSAMINPVKNSWNKTDAARNYGYKHLVQPSDEIEKFGQLIHKHFWSDGDVFDKACILSDTLPQPYCILPLTISTHAPFDLYPESYNLNFQNDNMPDKVFHYLGALHYADLCMERFLLHAEQSGLLDNSVLVITGDHIVFRKRMYEELMTWKSKQQFPLAQESNYCPLIVFSPDIKHNIRYDSVAYQMDIYPTVLSLTGLDNHPWQGFGINLLDSAACRQFTPEEAYMLSDKLIRSNFFSSSAHIQ